MHFARSFAPFAALTLCAAGVSAEPATPEGARAIEQGYAAYFTAAVVDKGILTVSPEGESYLVAWDLQKAIDLAKPPPGALKIESLTYYVTPGAGGAWTLKADHFPRLDFNFAADKGQANGGVEFQGFRLNGLYDPNASEFLTSKLAIDKLAGAMQMAADAGHNGFKVAEEGLAIETRAKPADDGRGVDVALVQAVKGVSETVSAPQSGGDNEPLQMDYEIADAVGDAALTGLRAREISDFWTYVVAHLQDKAAPPDLKARVLAMLPLWNEIRGQSQIHDLSVRMPEGAARMKTLGESIRLSGFTPIGAARIGVEIEDISLNTDMAPAWVGSFWPASLSLAVSASSEGWDKIARIALDDPRFADKGDLSPAAQAQIQQILLAGHPKLVLEPGRLKVPSLDLAFEGEATLEQGSPVGRFKISADSLDPTIALMQEAAKTEPELQKAILGVTFVKGLAKTGADGRLEWNIEANGNGEIMVNGTPLPPSK